MFCMCGATDCPSCGPAQGYRVRRLPSGRHVAPETPEEEDAIEAAWDGYWDAKIEQAQIDRAERGL